MATNHRERLAWIVVLLLVLVSTTSLLLVNGFYPVYSLECDSLTFYDAARNLYHGLPFSTFPSLPKFAHAAPGYPFFAFLTYVLVSGVNPHFTIAIQILLHPIIIICAFLIVRRYGGRRAGVLAAAFLAFLPNLLGYSLLFLSEQLSIVIYMLALALLFRAFDRDTLWRFVLAGLVFGLLLYLKPVYQAPVLLTGLLILLLWKKPFIRRIFAAAILCGVMTVTTIPWLVRNYQIFGKLTPMTVVYGEVMHSGNVWFSPDGFQRYQTIIKGEPQVLRLQRKYADAELREEELLREDAFNFIRAHPGLFLSWMLARAVQIWKPYPGRTTEKFGLLVDIPFIVFYVIVFLGVIIAFFQKPPPVFLWVNLVFFGFIYIFQMTNHTLIRYRLAFEPNLCLLAGYGWVALYHRWRELRRSGIGTN